MNKGFLFSIGIIAIITISIMNFLISSDMAFSQKPDQIESPNLILEISDNQTLVVMMPMMMAMAPIDPSPLHSFNMLGNQTVMGMMPMIMMMAMGPINPPDWPTGSEMLTNQTVMGIMPMMPFFGPQVIPELIGAITSEDGITLRGDDGIRDPNN